MTCQISSNGTCSESKHNSGSSDDIFQAVFLLAKISGSSASHGSQLHHRKQQQTRTWRQREKKLLAFLCYMTDWHLDRQTSRFPRRSRLFCARTLCIRRSFDLKCFASFSPFIFQLRCWAQPVMPCIDSCLCRLPTPRQHDGWCSYTALAL